MTRVVFLASAALIGVCGSGSGQVAIAATSPASAGHRADEIRNGAELASFFEAYDKARPPASTALADMRARFDRSKLSPDDQLSYDVFEAMMRRSIDLQPFGNHSSSLSRGGAQAPFDALIKMRVDSVRDAEAYLSSLNSVGGILDQKMAEAKEDERASVLPPNFVISSIIDDARTVITGAPFDGGPDSALFADFKSKVNRLQIDPAEKARLTEASRKALLGGVKPAYQRFASQLQALQKSPNAGDGLWRFKDGYEYFSALLRSYTTTNLTPEQIHSLGLQQVARIHDEMRGVMARVGFTGTLQQFFETMRTDKRFFLPNTDEGRKAFLDRSEAFHQLMEAKLPSWFNNPPKAPLVVKAEARKQGGLARYQEPSDDGSRPGIYWVNLYDMNDVTTVDIESVFYHEGIPGHHLQRLVQTGLGSDVPRFRRQSGFAAYSEGWAFYAEGLAKDMGLYTDPYSDFGRLQGELHRAMRLVVDSGVHYKRWSREQAIKYVEDNSAEPKGSIPPIIEAYIMSPGRPSAYMVGKLKIEELRDRAKAQLGSRFDIKDFHDVVLRSGPVPLDVMERNVNTWIARQKRLQTAGKSLPSGK